VELEPLFRAVREACSTRAWSQGIELARGDAVDGISEADDEVTLRVKSPGRPVAPEVMLYLDYEEWDCSCEEVADCCEHVAAAMIALRRARKEGRGLPRSAKAGGRVSYRLATDGDRLAVPRVVLRGDEELELTVSLAAILAGRERGPAVEPSKVDLSIDRLLSMTRVRSLPMEIAHSLLRLLAEVEDVRLGDAKVRVDATPLGPRAIVRDAGRGGFVLRLERPTGVERVVSAGVVACRDDRGLVVRPLGSVEVVGAKLERLPAESHYGRDRAAELVAEVLPRLRESGQVLVESKHLPKQVSKLEPRIIIDVEQHGAALMVLPSLVYGDPPCARADGDQLVHLGGPLPSRDRRAEGRAVASLREQLDLVPGRRVEVTGRDAIAMAAKLRGYRGTIEGGAHDALYSDDPLDVELDISGTAMSLRFQGVGDVDAADVMRAWERGDDVVALSSGGWAALPVDWLQRFGDRVSALLAARDADGRLAPHARPALAKLCDELERPRPPELQMLAPLIDDFETIPAAELPSDLEAELRDYQQRGVDWLCFLRRAGLGAVLADDMGLGKTIQALCAVSGRTLVVCPRSVVHNWVDEIDRFRPALRHRVYHGAKRELDPNADITLTTYALLRNDIERLAAEPWSCVVLDESQAIKNPDSQVARAAFRLQADFRVTMSGTPVENRLAELWSQMHFVNRGLLGGREDFRVRFERPIASGSPDAAARLRQRIKPFVLRRRKTEVLSELPPRTDALLHCVLDEAERRVYDAVLLGTRDKVVKQLAEGGSVLGVLEALLRLRQAACDTALVPGQPDLGASSKLRRLVMALDQAAGAGSKALVFSQWTSLLDRVEPLLGDVGIDHCRLDGSTRDRAAVVRRFQHPTGPPVMLISLKAGGTGLNLTAADHVFLLDPWWNPAVEDQAADRAHRIGQDKPVMVYRMVAKDTVEERILLLQDRKRALADAALGQADAAAAITRDDLLALVGE